MTPEFENYIKDNLVANDTNGGLTLKTNLVAGDIEIGAVEIKNGSSDTRATVLAASTAPATTDTSIVVAINPIGANIGGFTAYVSSTVVMSVAGAYAAGDYMGTSTTPQSFTNVVRTSGGTGIIESIVISDKITTTNVAMELWLFSATFVAPTDNAAWAISDTENLTVQAVIPISTSNWYASSNGQVYTASGLNYVIKPAATSLFYALVARDTTPAFTSADLTINLGILQD